MKEIQLTQNQVALVDDEDFDYLSQWKWHAKFDKDTESFYASRVECINGNRIYHAMHRVILRASKGILVDHINHDTLDNQKKNLRLATNAENNHNSRKRKDNTSGYKGVSWYSRYGKWKAQIQIHRRRFHLGYFDNPEQAYHAYCEAARKYHKDFAHY